MTSNKEKSKLGDPIVKVAFQGYPTVLDEKLRQRLFQDKIDRAKAAIEARAKTHSFA